MDLDKILKGCRRNSLKSQSQLYKTYKDDLYVLCLKYCKNKEEAQDNLQDAFMEIFKQIKTYKGTGSFEGWMKRITIHKAIDKFKKKKNTINFEVKESILKDTTIESDYLEEISLEEILGHIQSLPAQYQMVFNLYELDGYSHKEIATLLDISISTSKSNLHRAKSILKQKIKVKLAPSKIFKNT